MKRKTIRNHKDFILEKSYMDICPIAVIKTSRAKFPNNPRYGIVASKRAFKTAVERNRVKRLLRDWIAFNEDLMLPENDYVFIARIEAIAADRDVGRNKIKYALKRLAKNYEK